MVSSIDGGVGVKSSMTRPFSEIASQGPALASYDAQQGRLGDAARAMTFGAQADSTIKTNTAPTTSPRILYAELGKPTPRQVAPFASNLDNVTAAGGGISNLMAQRTDFRPFPERPPALQQASFSTDNVVSKPPMAGESNALRPAVDKVGTRAFGPAAVSDFANSPAFKQFHDGLTPLAVDHRFTLDSTHVHQTALVGPYKYWTRDVATMRDGSKCELIKDALGKERFRMEMDKSGKEWNITETDYQKGQTGRESLWRSATREYSSKGTQSVNYYENGVKTGGKTDPLDLRSINA